MHITAKADLKKLSFNFNNQLNAAKTAPGQVVLRMHAPE